MSPKAEVLKQIDALIPTGKKLNASYRLGKMASYHSNEPEERFRAFVTSAVATVVRVTGNDSEYYKALPHNRLGGQIANAGYDKSLIATVLGVLQSLRDAVDNGLLTTLESRLRANVHDDFLTQANDLLTAGYHVAAMVIAGGVLENHLLKLVTARGLTWHGSGSLSKYNDLLKDNVYAQPVWRRIQSIADVRNDAAHGNTAAVNIDDVKDALNYIPRVLTDYAT
jgi:hypothetical protein